MNLDTLTDLVAQRLQQPIKARLIGKKPTPEFPFQYVQSEPYDAVVLGILQPGVMLRMPTDLVCCALLNGLPVYLWPEQPYRESKFCGSLQRELRRKEERLLSFGVEYLPNSRGWITGHQAHWMKKSGMQLVGNYKLTPLAQEILEGQHDCRNSNRKFLGNEKM